MSLADHLLSIERALWRSDPHEFMVHLRDDAVLVFASTGPIDKGQAVEGIAQAARNRQRWSDVAILDPRVNEVSPGAALLTYRSVARREREAAPTAVLASSLYLQENGTWRLQFHQQTPTDDAQEQARPAPAAESVATRKSVRALAAGVMAAGAVAAGAVAFGAIAVGAAAIGACAIGRLAVDEVVLRRARLGSLTVGSLKVQQVEGPDVG